MTANNKPLSFTHSAMGTIFEIKVDLVDSAYAAAAAVQVFQLVDRLEQYLSHFIQNSDIRRISSLEIGQSTRVSLETFECLQQCREMYSLSHGVFDVTIGALYHAWLNIDKSVKHPTTEEISRAREHVGLHHLELDENNHSIAMTGGPVQLDLGGFGKGYTLDKAAELLADWDIESYMLNAGQSSLRFGAPPSDTEGWDITLSDPFHGYAEFMEMSLSHTAISGSGLQKGLHIIDPRTAQPIENRLAAWSFAPSAAFADGWSTAFMMMSMEEITAACAENTDLKAVLIMDGEKPLQERLHYFGDRQTYKSGRQYAGNG
jgi:FAD:protein FMN transferase